MGTGSAPVSDGSDQKASKDSGSTGGPDPGKMILAINGVIAAVGGTSASTHSLAATVVAGGVGLACAALFAWRK